MFFYLGGENVSVDVNDVVKRLSQRISQLEIENAILKSQLEEKEKEKKAE